MHNKNLIASLAFSALVAGCGGCSGGGNVSGGPATQPTAPPASPTPTPVPTATPTPATPTPATPTPAPPPLTLQENYPGVCSADGVIENTVMGYTGSGYINTDNVPNSSITWKVSAPNLGTRTLEWTYTSASDNPGKVSSNNELATDVQFTATGAGWSTAAAALLLKPGENIITLRATGAGGLPHIDSLAIFGDAISALNCDGSPVPESDPNPACIAGSTFEDEAVDCRGARIGLDCPGDGEGQPPVLSLRNATVKNVIITADGGADGIHCLSGDCVLENVIWEDICEDAATHRSEGGTMTITGGWAFNGTGGWGGNPDKIFQHNSKNSTTIITGGFKAIGDNGKLWRSCGNCSNNGGPRHVVIDNVTIWGEIGDVVGLNSNAGYDDTAMITNLSIQNYSSGNPPVCVEWTGVDRTEGSSTKLGESWDTDNCKVSPSDIISF